MLWGQELQRGETKLPALNYEDALRRCSTSHLIRGMQIRRTVKHHHTPIRTARTHNADHTKFWTGRGATGILSHSLSVGMQTGTATWEDSRAAPYKTKHILTVHSSNCGLWYLPKGGENLCPHRKLHLGRHLYSRLIHKTWKQPRCPSVSEERN